LQGVVANKIGRRSETAANSSALCGFPPERLAEYSDAKAPEEWFVKNKVFYLSKLAKLLL
jgi:hypothetical protein